MWFYLVLIVCSDIDACIETVNLLSRCPQAANTAAALRSAAPKLLLRAAAPPDDNDDDGDDDVRDARGAFSIGEMRFGYF